MARFAVVVFAYNRLENCKKLIYSLLGQSAKFDDIVVLVALDKGKNKNIIINQHEFIHWIRSLEEEIQVNYNKQNLGLKKQIIYTLDRVSLDFEAFIVLEEDLLISNNFLNEMRKRLVYYRNISSIWTINAYCNSLMENESDYLTSYVTSWGWATWSDRWRHLTLDSAFIIEQITDWRKFNFGNNYEYKLQLYWNHYGIKQTWAVFWYATIFLQAGYALQIGKNLIENKGFVGGENYKKLDVTYESQISNGISELVPDIIRLDGVDPAEVMLRNIVKRRWLYHVWRIYHWIKVWLNKG